MGVQGGFGGVVLKTSFLFRSTQIVYGFIFVCSYNFWHKCFTSTLPYHPHTHTMFCGALPLGGPEPSNEVHPDSCEATKAASTALMPISALKQATLTWRLAVGGWHGNIDDHLYKGKPRGCEGLISL